MRSEGEGEDLYIRAAELHPDIVFHHYNERHDAVQAMFMQLIGEKRPDVPAKLDQAHAYIRARVPNFRTYTSGGHDEAIIGGYYDAVLAKNAIGQPRTFCWIGSTRVGPTAGDSSIGLLRPLRASRWTTWLVWSAKPLSTIGHTPRFLSEP